MNKRRTYIALLLLLAFGFCLWLFWFSADLPSDTETTDPSSAEVSDDSSNRDAMRELIKEAKNDPEKAEGLFEALLALLPSKQRHQYQLGFGGLEDMSFYGQVVDQHGEPVAGATLKVEGGGKLLASGAGMYRAQTDDEGKFSVHMKGGSLIITEISHPNIKFLFPNHLQSLGAGGLTLWNHQRMKGGNEPLWSDYPEDNPYIFQAWRIDSDELVTNLKSDYDILRADCEGNIYTLDLLADARSKERKFQGVGDGQLRVRFFCEEAQATKTADWTLEIEAIDGGLLETDDIYMFKAPEVGYISSYRWTFHKDHPNYPGILSQKFYFYSNHGKEYGSLVLSFRVFQGGPILNAKYNINPNGGRSLLGPDRSIR